MDELKWEYQTGHFFDVDLTLPFIDIVWFESWDSWMNELLCVNMDTLLLQQLWSEIKELSEFYD